jgi:hypothetical protein
VREEQIVKVVASVTAGLVTPAAGVGSLFVTRRRNIGIASVGSVAAGGVISVFAGVRSLACKY